MNIFVNSIICRIIWHYCPISYKKKTFFVKSKNITVLLILKNKLIQCYFVRYDLERCIVI